MQLLIYTAQLFLERWILDFAIFQVFGGAAIALGID
jgi:hypothetical protein